MKTIKEVLFLTVLFIILLIGCSKDEDPSIAPIVSLTDPIDLATGIASNKAISATFNVPMDNLTISSVTFTLSQGTTAVSGKVTYNNQVATFTPTTNLLSNKSYTAVITTGAKDMTGHALTANHVVNFTTGIPDATLPTVSTTEPGSGATDIARNKVISVTFSEEMNASTLNTSTFTLKQGANPVAGTVNYTGPIAFFTPSVALMAATLYTASVTTDAKDLAGNSIAAKTWNFTTGGSTTTLTPVDLGSSGNYVILAKTAVNNSSTSAVTGDIGLSPAATSYVTGLALTNGTGFATSTQVTGKIYAADMASPTPTDLTTAVSNMITAYNNATGRQSPDFAELGSGNIGGKTLAPGLYKWTNNVLLPTDVTLSGGANDVWIFQIAGNLTMSSAVKITLSGGAQAKNIFWQIAGQATIGTTAHFEGVILSMTGITFQTNASLNGRALAQTAVILDSNVIAKP